MLRPLLALVMMATGCSPIIRFGDIEPPPGERIVATVSYRGNSAMSDANISQKLRSVKMIESSA